MTRKIFFFINTLLLNLIIIENLFAAETSIIPQKKPLLDKVAQDVKVSQGILKPKSKPSKRSKKTK